MNKNNIYIFVFCGPSMDLDKALLQKCFQRDKKIKSVTQYIAMNAINTVE